jgi:PleD family two-component response regulator
LVLFMKSFFWRQAARFRKTAGYAVAVFVTGVILLASLALRQVLEEAVLQRSGNARTPPARILIVDDSMDSADSLALLVSMASHTVKTAYDGPSALAAARTFKPDVVVLDIGLPVMDGYEVKPINLERFEELLESRCRSQVA